MDANLPVDTAAQTCGEECAEVRAEHSHSAEAPNTIENADTQPVHLAKLERYTLPGWLIAQTAADVEELIRVLGERKRSAPLRQACRRMAQDSRYMQEIVSMARKKVRP